MRFSEEYELEFRDSERRCFPMPYCGCLHFEVNSRYGMTARGARGLSREEERAFVLAPTWQSPTRLQLRCWSIARSSITCSGRRAQVADGLTFAILAACRWAWPIPRLCRSEMMLMSRSRLRALRADIEKRRGRAVADIFDRPGLKPRA